MCPALGKGTDQVTVRVVLDGVFTRSIPTGAPVFHALSAPTDAEVADVLDQVYRRVRRLLRRRGRCVPKLSHGGPVVVMVVTGELATTRVVASDLIPKGAALTTTVK
jgi:hypothetical protein